MLLFLNAAHPQHTASCIFCLVWAWLHSNATRTAHNAGNAGAAYLPGKQQDQGPYASSGDRQTPVKSERNATASVA